MSESVWYEVGLDNGVFVDLRSYLMERRFRTEEDAEKVKELLNSLGYEADVYEVDMNDPYYWQNPDSVCNELSEYLDEGSYKETSPTTLDVEK